MRTKTITAGFLKTLAAIAVGTSIYAVHADGIENGVVDNDGITDIAKAPSIGPLDKIILTVDQRGNLSSTNAVATSADLAAVAASNQYSIALQEATYEGYQTATNLLNAVAQSVGDSTIVFCSPELVSFTAGVSQEEFDTKFKITRFTADNSVAEANKTINGVSKLCKPFILGYVELDGLDVSPGYEYKEHIGTNSTEWASADNFSSIETLTQGVYTNALTGDVYSNEYRVRFWVPKTKATGFFRCIADGSAVPNGETLDIAGVKGGYTGVIVRGNMTLNVVGGYIIANGTGNTAE